MDIEVECGFNTNDETINFGSRKIADNAPYESVTFASLKIKANSLREPAIASKLNEDKLYCSVNEFFGVFLDGERSTLKFFHTADHIIDEFFYYTSSKLLFLFLRDGSLQVLKEISEEFNVLHKVEIVKNEQLDEKFFINSYSLDFEQNKIYLLLVTSNGQILRLNIQEPIDSNITLSPETIRNIESKIEHSTYNNGKLFLHGSKMWVLDLLTDNLISSNPLDIKFVKFTGFMILSLLSSGKVAYICPVTLQHYFKNMDHPINEMSIINDERGNMKFITATSIKDASGNIQLYLFRPDFSIIYTLTIGNDVILTNMDSEVNEIKYISLIKSEGELNELRFQTIVETDPQKRLKRLLRRNMFDEAEQFARSENLDVNIVSKEKAKVIAEKWRITSRDVDVLINIFNTLDDHLFILECCSIVEDTCENADDLIRIMKYACNIQASKKDETAKEMQYNCNRLLIKFNLFRLAGYCDMNQWKSFSDENLINEMKKLLKQQKIFQAITVYSHLSQTEIESLDEKCIQEILDLLNAIDLYDVNPILPKFMSLTLKWLPSSLKLFMDWLEMKMFHLEKQHSHEFPENAIEFLQANSKCLNIKHTNSYMLDKEIKNCSEKVETLLKILNNAEILKSQFGVRMAVSDLMQEPQIVVRNLLNLDLTIDVYKSILQEFTYKYIIENNLDPDEIFYNALIDSLKYQESYWSNTIGSILSCIISHDLKLQAVEKIFSRAKLPWSDNVKQIGIQTLKECYPKSGNVQQQMAEEPKMTVLSRLEYKFEISNSNIYDLQFLVRRIIRCNLPSMISDAFTVCEDKDYHKIETMRLLLHHFIEKGDFNNVFKLLEEDDVIVKEGLEFVLADIDHISEIWTPSEAENYAYILNSKDLTEQYNSLCKNEFDSYKWQKETSSFFAAYKIKTYFHVEVSGIDISQPDMRKNLINEIRPKIIQEYESGHKSLLEMLESLRVLATIMGISKEKLYSQCWKIVKVNKNEFLYRVAEEFLNDSVNVKYLCLLVVYIMENIYYKNVSPETESSFSDSFSASYGTEATNSYFGKFIKMASQLISKAIWNADVDDLAACLKIVPWVNSIFFFNRYKKQDKQSDVFSDDLFANDIIPSFTSLLAIHKVFNLYTSFIAQSENISYKYLSYYQRNGEIMSEECLLNRIQDLEVYLVVLNQESESLLAYKLLTTLQTQLMVYGVLDPRIYGTLKGIIKKHFIPNLIQHSLLMGQINKNLLQTSLRWCDAEETEKFIVRTMQHNRKIPERVTVISEIAVRLFDFHKKNELSSYFKEVMLSASWWERLKHLNIELDLFFRETREGRLKLIIQSEEFDIKLIKDYCEDYNLADIQSFYLFYLKTHLLKWKPRYEIETNNIGRRKLIMKGNQQKELFQKCEEVLHYIVNKEKVEKMLEEIWSQVNFYYYEVFICILDLYRERSFKHLELMLKFLETYERINKPTDIEIEKWFNTFSDSQSIEPLSEFRILFNSSLLESKDIWNIIRKEISLENCTKWFEAVQAFSYLNVDNICSFLVKELVAQGVLKIIKPGDWVIPKHTLLFNEIDNCLDYMKDDMKKLTAAYLLLSNTPEGADQVTIAEIAFRYANEYKMKTSDSQVSIAKIEKKYQRCLSMQILHKHKLAEPHYIDLILNIEHLLLALYHDERIVRKMNNFCQYCPDINTAAEKLAEVFNFDIKQFREKLVTNYLMDSNLIDFSGDIAIEYLKKLNSNEKSEEERSENNLKRAAYICSDKILIWHDYLWNKEYRSNKSDFYRARCVKCLLIFADKIAITTLSKQSFESILAIYDQLTLSSILSKFGLQINLNDTSTWNIVTKKLALIGSRDSVLAMAKVCKILKIKKMKYWEFIIGNMDRCKMYSDLIEFLEYTKNEDFKYEKFYIDAWTNLIGYTVNKILTLEENEKEDKISKDLIILQKCPVMFLLDLNDLIQKCIQSKNQRVAEILVQYFPKDEFLESTLE
ncbi:uncharacterized protein LOC123679061 [Harmonia axyridis]|uniref:uncharacterized protein LOC123679061 n=1 Tax=Harmonia axyridis TaxID=115357 RepID=UPI001E2776FA|nr:uncharacterized protein LOC123679061 [Harmonia axyridis]